ncbi:mannose-1-phosphate guanylyltransferase/mannose-6-phosphate isomerase [Parvibaculum sp.]|uniref:mannose-1-phosphate guanylyltransferase/mannose-6-phosphate isomerase n=1 Tax=Parvibaculum sp. TaxID=2024848 RepID=UPI002C5E0C81|nr:mannose-1-phosphate guanylyltransferase/mannose-6-phosphate isomerase [Parvibaculum sp.]HUD53103.1 mannose-1-phosphate guanylyltransferase/mannose-6-phosphate isomerase [Parvibaculum sp.]
MNVLDLRRNADEAPARHIYPVLLCGGSGTRLWPLSRSAYPKQLLPLLSDRTMLQETAARTADDPLFGRPLVIANEEHRFLIAEQLLEIGVEPWRIVLEPTRRNTAPALAAAALLLIAEDPGAIMFVEPSDHLIADVEAFRNVVHLATPAAAHGHLVTFGIAPTRPETGYGYIESGNGLEEYAGVHALSRFVEKPDGDTAQTYIESGAYHWNSGIFLLPAVEYLKELERLQPGVVDACRRAVEKGRDDKSFFHLDEKAFAASPNISIDYAVMEHTDRAAIVPAEMGWNDVGSWHALMDAHPRDADGNVLHGDVMAEGVSNCYIRSDGRLVAALGLDNVIVVSTEDALLVASADRCGDVGRMVETLSRDNRSETAHHKRVYRPWGFYQTVDLGDRFQVKRIMVKPGAQLSLQMHFHRAEHWVVVSGTARITCDGKTQLLRENESTYIPQGMTHRLENPGRLPLHLIEVQSGAYLGEDDIVRFEDNYGRN